MAEMIPESVPSGRPRGERRVFDVLQNLPDDYIVYYEPVIADRYPDFVVIGPDVGLMVIEVKGWTADSIKRADHNEIVVSFGGQPQNQKHPVGQAREYMFRLMGTFKDDPAFSPIRHQVGKWAGRFIFPFGHLVVFTAITSEQLRERDPHHVFPPTRVISKDILDAWEKLDATALKEAIKGFFDPYWEFPPLNKRQIDLLRAVIHPEIVVKRPSAVEKQENDSALHVLDKRQEIQARKIGDGHRVINGVAGSGKTVLLIYRARWLSSEDPARRILVLCFNRCLAAYLKNALDDCPNVRATTTFHQWGIGLGAKFGFNSEKFGGRVLKKVQLILPADKYDAILIDEAQDFDPTWLQCAVNALKEPDDGDLIVVADGNQGLYKPSAFKWIDVGIKAKGRVIPLYRNYRNTEQIMHVAREFAIGTSQDTGEQIVPLEPRDSIRNGPAPLVLRAVNRSDEIHRVVAVIKDLLNGIWDSRSLGHSLRPKEIAVLYSHVSKKKKVDESIQLLRNGLKQAGIPAIWLQDPSDKDAWMKIDEPGVKIQTIHSAKGLQYRAVVLIRADILPIPLKTPDEAKDARLLYVGLTRAEDYLAVSFPADSAFTQRIQTACREAKLSFAFHCSHCGYCGRHSKSVLPQGKTAFRIKCPECGQKSTLSLPW